MKKTILLLTLFVTVNFAQTNKITGNWIMTKAVSKENTKNAYFIMNFNPDNKMEAMGMEVGTWQYNKDKNLLIMNSKLDDDFNGNAKILKLTEKELLTSKNGWKYFYKKIDKNKIPDVNKKSKLAGMWQLQTNDKSLSRIIKFELPDKFTFVEIDDGSTETSKGTWIFEPVNNSVIIITMQHLMRGEAKIKELSENKLVLVKDTITITAKKIKSDESKLERLSFKEENFPDENDITSFLPWNNFDEMVSYLAGIKQITYRLGTLNLEANKLHFKTLISKIKVNPNEPSVDIKNLAITGNDTMQYSEKFKDDLSERYNNYFPETEPFPVRINKTKTVTVPAGTFECTVVEGFDADDKVRMYMINDKPGIYAKIIREKIDVFGKQEYSVKELVKIN